MINLSSAGRWALCLVAGGAGCCSPNSPPNQPPSPNHGDVVTAGDGDSQLSGDDSTTPSETIVFFFDMGLDAIFRLQDLNHDGDLHDPAEMVRFFDDTIVPTGVENAQGLVALGPSTLLAIDNMTNLGDDDNDNVVWLEDQNGDGDAMDAGESWIWFDGVMPDGVDWDTPNSITRGPDGAIYVVDNYLFAQDVPHTIYQLMDLNSDGDALDAGEASKLIELSPAGATREHLVFDIAFTPTGDPWILDVLSDTPNALLRVAPPNLVVLLDSDICYPVNAMVLGPATKIESLVTGEILLPTTEIIDPYTTVQHLVAARDIDGDDQVDPITELRDVWDASASVIPAGPFSDLAAIEDGSVVAVDMTRRQLFQLMDSNRDDLFGPDELKLIFDPDTAVANGHPQVISPLSCAVFWHRL